MHRLSIVQALSLWSDLEAALYGKNGYGGDTAEIYIYRLLPYVAGERHSTVSLEELIRSGTIIGNGVRDDYANANASLHNLLVHFAATHDVRIEVDGKELGPWLKTALYTHRVHVKVIDLRARKPADPRYLLTLDRPMALGNIFAAVRDKLEEKRLDDEGPVPIEFRPGKDGKVDVFAMEEREE